MCCSRIDPRPEETVGECPYCQCSIDNDGDSTEAQCTYSPVSCKICGDQPCDMSC